MMSWLHKLRNRLSRMNSISTPVGGIGWDNSLGVTGEPDILVSYVDKACIRSSGQKMNEIVCSWNGILHINNQSPATAFKVSIQLPETVELLTNTPKVCRYDREIAIPMVVRRSFDEHELFPSKFAKPFEQTLPDVDPNVERYPAELQHLRVTVVCENEAGRRFSFTFARNNPSQKELAADNTFQRHSNTQH